MGPGFAILHHQIGLCLADETVNEKGSRPLYFPLTARTPRPWTTGTGSAMPIGGPRTARSWPTKARAAIWSRRTPTRTSRSGPSSGPTSPRTAASFSHLRSNNHRLQERVRGEYLRSTPRPGVRHRAVPNVAGVSPMPKAGGNGTIMRSRAKGSHSDDRVQWFQNCRYPARPVHGRSDLAAVCQS